MKKISDSLAQFTHKYMREPKQQDFWKHSHNDYEIYVFLQGKGDYIIEGLLYELKLYDLILIKPAKYHNLQLKENSPYERIVINFQKAAILPELFPVLDIEKEVFSLGKNSKIIESLIELSDISDKISQVEKAILLNLKLNEILLRLKYLDNKNSTQADALHPAVCKILDYINENITKPLDIKTLSSALFFSPTYISHIFSKHLKISVMKYIRQKKIYFAQNLIRSGVNPTKAALMCGFNNYSTFFRIYKKKLNISPEQDKNSSSY